MMRVSRGFLRSRELTAPSGNAVRPTSNIVKQALFNMLAQRVVGADVLDLFGGSGQMGIEALSCGAKSAVFVDNAADSITAINKNLSKMGLAAQVLHCDFCDAMRRLYAAGKSFDIIIADPPYAGGFYNAVQQEIAHYGLLKPDGILVLEHDKLLPPEVEAGYAVINARSYGKRSIMLLKSEGKP